MEIKFKVTWTRLLLVLWVSTAVALMAQEVTKVENIVVSGTGTSALRLFGGVQAGASPVQTINTDGSIPVARLNGVVASGNLPTAPTFSGTVTAGGFTSSGTSNLTTLNVTTGSAITSYSAPNFIDSDNTSFNVNPNGTSNLSSITATGTMNLGSGVAHGMLGNWVFDTGGLGGGAPQVRPANDNSGSVGLASQRWNLIRGVTVSSGDLVFENGWTFTETYKIGVARPGIALLSPDNNLMAVIGTNGFEHGKDIPFVRTTAAQRAAMVTDQQRKQLAVVARQEKRTMRTYLSPPDPKLAVVGGAPDRRRVPR